MFWSSIEFSKDPEDFKAYIKQYPKGSFVDTIGHVIDIMPTCVELAGAKYPDTFKGKKINPLPGKSLAPVLSGGDVHQE